MLKPKKPIKVVLTIKSEYAAMDDNWEPGSPIGYGNTKDEAVADLYYQFEHRKE